MGQGNGFALAPKGQIKMKTLGQKLIRLAKLVDQERILADRARALRAQILTATGGCGYYSCVQWTAAGEITLTIPVADYQQLVTDAKPVMATFERAGQVNAKYGRLHYPRTFIVAFAPDRGLWVEAWSESFDVPADAIKPVDAETAAA